MQTNMLIEFLTQNNIWNMKIKDILESIKATNLGLLTTGVDYSNLNSKASMTSVGNISVAVNVNGSLTNENYAKFADLVSDMAVEKVNNELKNY